MIRGDRVVAHSRVRACTGITLPRGEELGAPVSPAVIAVDQYKRSAPGALLLLTVTTGR